MEIVGSILKYVVLGFFGLIGLLIVLAVLFGKRVIKQWEYEADFRNDNGREFGEFEVELSQVQKEEPAPLIKAKFQMRHSSLTPQTSVQVFVDERLILEGRVENEGRVLIRETFAEGAIGPFASGQNCRVSIGGMVTFNAELRPD